MKKSLAGLWAMCVLFSLQGTTTHAAAPDIVLYSTDATNLRGNWTRIADATAAVGQAIGGADKGWSSPDAVLARPVDSFEYVFSAPANTAYHVWVRMRARNNSKYNDSVFAQFSDAVTASGAPVYRLGTSSGLVINLQRGNGAPLSGWGWVDGAYWLQQPSTLKFSGTGTHTMRVQTREDGVQIDQVVLRPVNDLSRAPGSLVNDRTILVKSTPLSIVRPSTSGTIKAKPSPKLASVGPGPAVGTTLRLSFATGGSNVADVIVTDAASTTPVHPAAPPAPLLSPVVAVASGGDFQAALNIANPGDTILLEAGATFTGNFILPAKSGSGFVTIRSSAGDASLPGNNIRMSPAYAAQLPKIRSGNNMAALATAPGAHHYLLQFLEFQANSQGIGDILDLGDGSTAQNTLSVVPHDLVVDRVYIHGDVVAGQKRGIGLNSASTTVMNSYISDIKAVGQDSQAIMAWNGPGPYLITNNYLEAAGENIMFGGSDPAIPNLVPSDAVITRNHFFKPLAWRSQNWLVKNLFELKSAQRVTIEDNLFENNWAGGQVGYAIVFTPRNQDGSAPWTVVQQVRFANNIVRHVASGINILGIDNLQPSLRTNNIVIQNNLFEDISTNYGGSGRFALLGGGDAITIDHNTVFEDGWTSIYGDGMQTTGLVFTNNIVPNNAYGIMGTNASPGNGTIAMYFPGSDFVGGVFIGSSPNGYPANNYYPATVADVGFVDLAGGNYRLSPSSPFRNAGTDGTGVGCNLDASALNLTAPAPVIYTTVGVGP